MKKENPNINNDEIINKEELNNNTPIQEDDFSLSSGFKISESPITEESEYIKSSNNDTRISRSARRKNKRLRAILGVLAIILSAVFLATSFLLFMSEYLGIKLNSSATCTVDIKQGSGTSAIASELKEAGAINSSLMFRIYCKLAGYDGTFKYGVYTFKNELGYKEIAQLLQEEGEQNNSVEVTIPERASVDDIIEILEKNNVCTRNDFLKAMKSGNYTDISFINEIEKEKVFYLFEGYLFPDTYIFYNYDSEECAELAIRKMLKRTDEMLTDELKEAIKKQNKTLHEIITMASIVELEASASVNEMPKVAAVFYNRLEWDEPKYLGSSPTAEYPYGNGRYNTNNNEGLPPGPLCSPSLSAIKAAIYPQEDFAYTYFVTDSENKFYYNETYTGHNQTIAKLKQQGKWLG